MPGPEVDDPDGTDPGVVDPDGPMGDPDGPIGDPDGPIGDPDGPGFDDGGEAIGVVGVPVDGGAAMTSISNSWPRLQLFPMVEMK